MGTQEKVLSKEDVEVLLWVKVISDYEDEVYIKSDLDSKLCNFLDNYEEDAIKIERDTFEQSLQKMGSIGIFRKDSFELTKWGKVAINSLSTFESLLSAIKSGTITAKEVLEKHSGEIKFTLLQININTSLL